MAELSRKLSGIKYEVGQAEALKNEERRVRHQVNDLRAQVESVDSRHPRLNFHYQDPDQRFDRRQVKVKCTTVSL